MKKLNQILLVDDDEVNNFIVKELFQEHEIAQEITVKDSVDAAISYLQESENPPKVILLDINMPVKDGFDFLDEYYECNLNKNDSHIILLTSSLFEKDKAIAARYDVVTEFIIKPLDIEKLRIVVDRIFAHS